MCQEGMWSLNDYCLCLGQDSDGKCICKIPYSYPDGNGNCVECPAGCNCTEGGCVWCEEFTNREVRVGAKNISGCDCKLGTSLKDGYCVCFIFSTFTTDCPCTGSYEMMNGYCACLSEVAPTLHYLDTVTGWCYKCPEGCRCNETGCWDCEVDTLRWNYVNKTSGRGHCPCKQLAWLENGVCISCAPGYFFIYGVCQRCTECATCTKYGCTTCKEGMYLVNLKCVCYYDEYVNIDGDCVCPFATYEMLVQGKIRCLPCPNNCLQCKYLPNEVRVICTMCP